MKNNPLVISESVSCSGIRIRSFWDVHGDKGYQNVWPRDRKLPYANNTVVVVYTDKGQGCINVKNADSFQIRGNSVIFLDPQAITSYGCDGLVWKLYWIELFVDQDARGNIPFNRVISIDNKTHFEMQFVSLLNELKHRESFHRAYAAAIFTKIFYEWLVEANYVNKNPQQVAVQKVIDEMHLRMADNWQVKEMAGLIGRSEQHLRKMFIQQTGLSPKAYYQALKLDIAHALLKKGQHNITQLAYELGFSDAFHFSKAFKQKYNLSPSEVAPQASDYTKNLLTHD